MLAFATGLGPLSRPFSMTSAWVWESGDPPPVAGVTRDQVRDGALFLGDDGCGSYWALIVTGTHRGQIWNIADVGAQPFGCSFGFTTAAHGFAGWTAHWAAGRDWYA